MLQNLETLARDAKSWPFEQARNLLAHVLKKRLSDAERDAARLLIDAGKGEEALALLAGVDDPTSIEVRGDAHFALDKREDARKDYAEALRKLDVAAPQRQLLEFKLTQAGGTPETTGTES